MAKVLWSRETLYWVDGRQDIASAPDGTESWQANPLGMRLSISDL
jgi:hypothetical protein